MFRTFKTSNIIDSSEGSDIDDSDLFEEKSNSNDSYNDKYKMSMIADREKSPMLA